MSSKKRNAAAMLFEGSVASQSDETAEQTTLADQEAPADAQDDVEVADEQVEDDAEPEDPRAAKLRQLRQRMARCDQMLFV